MTARNGDETVGHSPKTGALIAYESGALSQRGRARVEKHLAGCDVCRRELAAIQMYDEAVDVVRDARLPKVEWSKMELALEREAQAQAKSIASARRRTWLVPAAMVALAAAAVLAITLWPDAPEAPVATHEAPIVVPPRAETPSVDREERVEPVLAQLNAHITLVAGHGEITTGGVSVAVSEGATIAEGATTSTDEGSTAHVVLASAETRIGLVLGGATAMRFASLDASETSLQLEHGDVSARVRGTRTIVLAGEYRIETEVAWFVVDLSPTGELAVDVREGEVHVTGPSTDRVLQGPALFHSAGTGPSLDATEAVGMAIDYGSLPRLHVARPGIVRWEIGDVSASGEGELAMRVGTGEVSISGWDARGRELHATATVGPDGLDLAPDELRPQAPRVRVGTLPEAVIRDVVTSHQSSLERCYERALRAQPDIEARVELQIAVDMTGEVSSVRLGGDAIPEGMASCLTHDVERWTFPSPDGGPMTFVLPVPFAPRH